MALMIDTEDDARTLIGQLGLDGCVAVCRPLFLGATAADGTVPQPVGGLVPLTADEAAATRAAGLAVLGYGNNIGYGDTTGPNANANGIRKAQEQIAAMQAVGLPPGVYPVADLETWAVDPPFLAGYCDTIRASQFGGSGILYGSADAQWLPSYRQAAAQNANVARALLWIARYVGWDGGIPTAFNPGVEDQATIAWQFADDGPRGVDVSVLRLPLLSVGTTPEGLWLPDGGVGSPAAAIAPGQSALIASLQAKIAAAKAALA